MSVEIELLLRILEAEHVNGEMLLYLVSQSGDNTTIEGLVTKLKASQDALQKAINANKTK